MSRRIEQISSTLARAIQDTITRGLHDPRISGMITVTGVDVPPDLATATVRFSVIPADREALTLHGLNDGAGYIRRQVGQNVRMRRVPTLKFVVDEAAKEQAAVLHAIAKARAELTPDSTEIDAPDVDTEEQA